MSTLNKFSGFLAVVAVVIAIVLGLNHGSSSSTGGSTSDNWSVGGNLAVTGTSAFTAAITAAAAAFSGTLQTDAGQLHSYPLATTTQATAETLVPADVTGYDTVILTPNNPGNTTLTFFASSTATTWLPAAGDTQHVCFLNSTTTANVNYIFAGGTGTTLLVASSTATVLGSPRIGPQKVGCFDFIRGAATATTFDLLGAYTAYQ